MRALMSKISSSGVSSAGGGGRCGARGRSSTRCTVSTSREMCASNGGVNASSQCGVPRKYSIDPDHATSSTRSGTKNVPPIHAPLDLAKDLLRCVRVRREHDDHDGAVGNRVDDRPALFAPRKNVAGSDPTTNIGALECRANRVS